MREERDIRNTHMYINQEHIDPDLGQEREDPDLDPGLNQYPGD